MPSKSEYRRGQIAEWAGTFLIMLLASSSLAWPFVVPTGSMENSILIGDHMIVDKLSYAPSNPVSSRVLPYTGIKRGDVIVFRYPLNLREDYVKRVIGIPGDRIRISAKQLHLNGRAVEEPYKIHKANWFDSYRDYFPAAEPNVRLPERALKMLAENVRDGELVVPPGHYFAMGDNRDESWDSRYWGLVPRENIYGKPWIIYWSFESSGDMTKAIDPTHLKDLALNFFSKTRWDRTLRIVRGYPLE